MAQGIASNAGELRNTFTDEDLAYAQEFYSKTLKFIGGVKSMSTVIGSAAKWESPVNSGHNAGVTADGGQFNTVRVNASVNPYLTLGQLVGSFSGTLMLKEVGKGDGAWTDAFNRGKSDVLKAMMTLADRFIAGGVGTGQLAVVEGAVSTSTSIALELPMGGLLLDPGMPIQIKGGGTEEDYTTISSYTPSTQTIVVADSQNLNDGDIIYSSLGASGGSQGLSTHVNGFGNLISNSGTVHNIDRSTYPHWKSQSYTNGGVLRPYSDDLVHDALLITETLTKSDGSPIDHLVSNKGQIRQYNKVLRADRRVSLSSGDLSSANTGVNTAPTYKYGDREIPWVEFTHIKPRTIYGIVKKHWRIFGKSRPTLLPYTELGLTNGVRNTTEEVFALWLFQIACGRFNDQFVLGDLSDPSLCGPAFGGTDV